MEYTYVILRLMENGQSAVEITTDDLRFAEEWMKERVNAIDGKVTNYQMLTVPYVMPPSFVTGSGGQYVNTKV